MEKDKDLVKGRILNFGESITKESKAKKGRASSSCQANPTDVTLMKSLIETTFKIMTSAIQSILALVYEDMAKEAVRKDDEFKLIMEKFGRKGPAKKGLDKKKWSEMNFKLIENTRAVYNLG
ncbi:hypothetical protein ACH5RR_023450 [Cinchona calisaya]|uniref:Uncharacterized protein n=1 Tax=Cinchona calisaya TaxID=153742 RepID=A0ABD2ZBU9_9GENT